MITIVLHLVLLFLFHTYGRSGWSIGSDWEVWSGERLWCGLVPVIIHLIARGLQQFLSGMVYLFVKTVQWSLGRFLQPVSWVLLLASILCSIVCSGLGLLLLLCGFLMQVCCFHAICDMQCVYVCMCIDDPLPTGWTFCFNFTGFQSTVIGCGMCLSVSSTLACPHFDILGQGTQVI